MCSFPENSRLQWRRFKEKHWHWYITLFFMLKQQQYTLKRWTHQGLKSQQIETFGQNTDTITLSWSSLTVGSCWVSRDEVDVRNGKHSSPFSNSPEDSHCNNRSNTHTSHFIFLIWSVEWETMKMCYNNDKKKCIKWFLSF